MSTVAPCANTLVGVDSNFAFYQNVYLSGYVATSRTEGRTRSPYAYRGNVNYNADRYGLDDTHRLQSREAYAAWRIERQNSDVFHVEGFRNYELLTAPLALAPGVRVPVCPVFVCAAL